MTLNPKKSIRNSELFAPGSILSRTALSHLSPFPKGAAPTFILSPSRNIDPIKIKAKAPNLHLQDSNAISPTSHRTQRKLLSGALAHPVPNKLLLPASYFKINTITPAMQFPQVRYIYPNPTLLLITSELSNKLCLQPHTKNLFHLVLLLLPGF